MNDEEEDDGDDGECGEEPDEGGYNHGFIGLVGLAYVVEDPAGDGGLPVVGLNVQWLVGRVHQYDVHALILVFIWNK